MVDNRSYLLCHIIPKKEWLYMAEKENKGVYGNVIGTKEYFKKLNEEAKISGLMKDSSSSEYYSSFTSRSGDIKKKLAEIYSDLENNIATIRYISKNDREELVKFLEGLNDYLKFSQNGDDMKFTQSKIILGLKDRRAGRKSSATQTQINEAVKKIYNGTKYTKLSLSDRKQLVEKAEKSGIRNLSRSLDANKKAFLADVAGTRDEKFLQDVLMEYNDKYQYKGKYRGKCGKNIASKEYISDYERTIFGSGLYSDFYKNYKYKEYIIKKLTVLVDYFMLDMQKITEENIKKQFQDIIKDMEKCGVKMHATYYGNPHTPKYKTYTYTLSKTETKNFAMAIKIGGSKWFVGIQGGLSMMIGVVCLPLAGLNITFVSSCISLLLAYDWDNLVLAADNGKRCKIKVTGILGESNEEFLVETFRIDILD